MTDHQTSEDLVYAFSAPTESSTAFSARGSGLYRSKDGGKTWEYALANLELTEPLPVTCVAVSPDFTREPVVLAGAPGGIFHSTDGGASWRALIFPAPPPTVSAVSFSPNFAQDETAFAGTMEDGVFISRNGGQRWVSWNFGLLDLNVMCLAISPGFATDETIYAGTETGIFRSTNGGRAWREVEMPTGYEAVLSLAAGPGGLLYAGSEGQGIWVTSDGGATWKQLGEGIIEDPVNQLQIEPGSNGQCILAATSSALFHSTDGGTTWKDRLPSTAQARELSAIFVPGSFASGETVLIGYVDGGVAVSELP